MRLFVFLGNPGKKYEKTRHNAGFLAADFLRQKFDFPEFQNEKKFFGEISKSGKNLFLKPKTFMNLSGKSARAVADFFKISPENIFLIFDDKDLKFGEIRFREKGSSGGHNGLKNIFEVFGTPNFPRIKIGISNEKRPFFADTADFVLSRFSAAELSDLEKKIFPKVAEKISNFLEK